VWLSQNNKQLTAMNYYITTRNEFEIVDLDDVIYFKADGNYTDIYYRSGKIKTILACLSTFDTNIAEMYQKEKLRSPFYRMGRSYLVNMDYVTSLNIQSQHLTFKCDAVKGVRCTKSLLKRMYNNLLEYHKLPKRKELDIVEDEIAEEFGGGIKYM
jgi:DNA-binding LytR/AlgR family response regulator